MAGTFFSRKRSYFDKVSSKFEQQEPKVERNRQFRRSMIDLNPVSVEDAIPMADYLEADIGKTRGGNLSSNLNWIVLNLVFAISFSFILPLIHIVVFFNVAFDSYMFLKRKLFYNRVEDIGNKV
jgi:hypothetical protein